ncbi:MAG: hypothetical protein CFE41_11510 [Burkholderiales bacterium PBB2]|nr:MAG: hypothetical protein CFE41_11510 [Burkholderiales bacterium PBB2]
MMRKRLAALGLLLAALHAPARAAPIDDLVLAAELDNGREITTLLVRGVDPNARDGRGRNALEVALREGSSRALDSLLSHPGTDVNRANAAGETPLMLAAIKGRLDWAKKLVARGAQINKEGWTPLHYACSGPDNGVALWLLSQGALLDARSPNGSTPLMMASRYGAMDLAEALLAAGADPSLRNAQELSALEFARAAERNKLVAALQKALQRVAPKAP